MNLLKVYKELAFCLYFYYNITMGMKSNDCENPKRS